jgi:hypothetical protein
MNRQWRIREVGETGLIKLQYPSVLLDFAVGTYAYLCVSSDATFDLNDTFIEMTLNNGAYEANYNFADGQYFSFAKGFLCATPNFTLASVQATCSSGVASNNASLTLQTKDNSTVKLGYSIGGIYTGVNFASATNVGALPFTLTNALSNPAYPQPYTIRGYCDASRYRDVVVILNPKICTSANLNWSVTPSSVTKNKGELATLVYTVTNSGTDTAPDVIINIPIPSNVTLLNSIPQQGIYNVGNKRWNVGALTVGSKTLTLTVKLT